MCYKYQIGPVFALFDSKGRVNATIQLIFGLEVML